MKINKRLKNFVAMISIKNTQKYINATEREREREREREKFKISKRVFCTKFCRNIKGILNV